MDPKPPIFQVNTVATTVSGPTAATSVTRSRELRTKARLGVIEEESGEAMLQIYRPSKSAHGWFSCDVYRRGAAGWEYSGKHERKYPNTPDPPAGSIPYPPESPEVWTRLPMTADEIEKTLELIRKR